MKFLVQTLACVTVGAALCGLTAGCAGVDAAEDGEPAAALDAADEVDTLAQGLTSVDMVDCSICATARACCMAVSTSSYCNNFNAERCETLDPGRQRTTKRNCLVLLRTVRTAWHSSGATPPPECQIPGE